MCEIGGFWHKADIGEGASISAYDPKRDTRSMGSKADIEVCPINVRFTPKSRHRR